MTAYQDYIDSNLTMILEYKMQEASGSLINTGTSGSTHDLAPQGTPNYQANTAGNYEGTGFDLVLDGGTTNDSFYVEDNSWANGLTTGSFIFIGSRITAGSDYIFSVSNGTSVGTDAWYMGYDGNEFCYATVVGGAGIINNKKGTILWPNQTNTPAPYVIVVVQDGSTMGLYVNGYRIMGQQLTTTDTDAAAWFNDAYTGANDMTTFGGFTSTAGAPSLPTNEPGIHAEYLGVSSTVMTAEQIRLLVQAYHGGGLPGGDPTTITGRNKFRRYWTDQIVGGPVPPTGTNQVKEIIAGGAFTDQIMYYLNCGPDRRFNARDNTVGHGDPFSGSNRTLIGGSWQHPTLSDDGYWILGNDGNSTAVQELSFKWNAQGWWDNASIDNATNFGQTAGGSDIDSTSTWYAQTRSAGPADLWKYDSMGDNWDLVTSTKFTTPPLNRHISNNGQPCRFGRGSNTDMLALGGHTTGTDTSGHYIYQYDSMADSWEKVTYTIQAPRAAYGCAIAPVRRHIFFGNNSTVTVNGTTGSQQVYMYKETSGGSPGTWTLDNSLWNNTTAHSDQGTGSTTPRAALFIDDDFYVACQVSTGSNYTNLWHFRWNGSYYAEQSSITHPGSDAQYRRFFSDIKATPDGTVLFTVSNNLGGAFGDPSFLVFDRNTTTGALTVRDTPDFDFMTPDNIHNNNTNQTSSGITSIHLRDTIPTTDL